MYDTILLPTDGSEGTETTLEHAIEVAQHSDAVLRVLYVVNKRLAFATEKDRRPEVFAELEATGETAVETAAASLEAAGCSVETEIRTGVPHREILDTVEASNADLIVMGSHGRTGRERLQSLGSVTEEVVEAATVPVLTVPIEDSS